MRSNRLAGSEEIARQGGHVAEMQRRRLLSAFVEVLAEQGLDNATVGRVCKRAGVSRRTFYESFDDREECLLAAFDAAVERFAQPVVAAYGADGSTREALGIQTVPSWCERIRDALSVLLEQLDAEPTLARMCVVETLKAGPLVAERRAAILSVLVAAIERGRDETQEGSEPPPLAGQGVVGGALSVIHARLLDEPSVSEEKRTGQSPSSNGVSRPLGSPHLADLTGALMAMIVHPYLGSAAARRELERPSPKAMRTSSDVLKDPFKDLSIRFTYRTARVLATIADNRGASNRLVADTSGIADEGQTSRLLARLQRAELIENRSAGRVKGEANAWALTERGKAVHVALAGRG